MLDQGIAIKTSIVSLLREVQALTKSRNLWLLGAGSSIKRKVEFPGGDKEKVMWNFHGMRVLGFGHGIPNCEVVL